jgi:Domain of unknown function (DUF5011)
MRKQISISWFSICAVLLFMYSCKKETTAKISKEVAVSFPAITLKGDELMILPVGGTFAEPGAILKDDVTGKESDLQPVSNDVNTAVPGLYVVLFKAANANGFETTVGRKVAVTSVTGTTNVAGDYIRSSNGIAMTIEKLAEGVYKITNPGGAGAGTATTVFMVETEKGVYTCPDQPNDAGFMTVTDIAFSATGVVWRVLNAGYGTQLRSFEKQ